MTEQGIVCPAYLMTSLLQLVCISGLQDVALSLFDSGVAAGLEPSVHCFSPLLKSCGTAQKARELLQRMEFVGIQANVISYTAAIKSCENTGDWRSALELLDLMRASGVTANEITYCCAINVASRGNAGDIAVNILREMLSLGFPPNLLCYGSALTGCAKVNPFLHCCNVHAIICTCCRMTDFNDVTAPFVFVIILPYIKCARTSSNSAVYFSSTSICTVKCISLLVVVVIQYLQEMPNFIEFG
jgi:pentatricopeptide repeat protein